MTRALHPASPNAQPRSPGLAKVVIGHDPARHKKVIVPAQGNYYNAHDGLLYLSSMSCADFSTAEAHSALLLEQ